LGSFNGHVFQICCDHVLYLKMLQVQVNNGLGKAYAGMLVNVHGLHAMGLLNDSEFEVYKNKYSVSLAESKENKNKSPLQIVKDQSRANFCRTQNKYFGNALDQWATMKPRNRKYFIEKAKLPENVNIKNAKLILELAEQESLTLEG